MALKRISIQEQKKRYYKSYNYVSTRGKRCKTDTGYFPTPKEAYERANFLKESKKKNANLKTKAKTIRSTMKEYLESLQEEESKIKAVKNTTLVDDIGKIRAIYNNYLSERIGSVKLSNVTSNDFCDIIIEANNKVIKTKESIKQVKKYVDGKLVLSEIKIEEEKKLSGRRIRGFKTIITKYVKWLSSKHYISQELNKTTSVDIRAIEVKPLSDGHVEEPFPRYEDF